MGGWKFQKIRVGLPIQDGVDFIRVGLSWFIIIEINSDDLKSVFLFSVT